VSSAPLHIRVGRFELNEGTFELREDGAPVAMERKPLALLIHLARHRDRVVRREELFQAIWPETAVGEDALSRAVLKVREALGEVGARGGSIQTVRGVGFRFLAEVDEDLSREPEATQGTIVRPLVGREAELGQLHQALTAARGGAGRIALLAGAAGIGKTRLAEQVAAEARDAGADVHTAFAWHGSGAPAFWVWVQVLRSCTESWSEDRLRDALGAGAPEIARVVPALRERLGVEPAPATEADEARFRLFDAIASFLSRAARRWPQVLVLEDLHWADPASLQTLDFLAGELAEERILVVATCRSDELSRGHPLEDALTEAARHDAVLRIPVQGLEVAEVGRLVEQLAGFTPSADLASALCRRTGGNPFFLRELVELIAARHSGDASRLGERIAAQLGAMPQSVRHVIARRLAVLSEASRGVADVASAIGRTFPLAWLARVSELDRAELLTALDEAAEAGVIEALPDREPSFRFAHDLLREVVYGELPEARRMRLHQRLAEALEVLHAGHLDPVVPALAYHYGEAAPLLEGTQAVDYAKRASEAARESLSYEEAAGHFEAALHAMDLVPDPDPARRAELLTCLGYAHQSAGRLERGREVLREAAAVARGAGPAAAQTLAVAAVGLAELGVASVEPEQVELLEAAVSGLGEGPSFLHVWLQGILAVHLVNHRGRRAEAEALSERTESAARERGDGPSLSYALAARAAVQRLSPRSGAAERLATLTEAVHLASDRTTELMIRLQRFGALLELVDMDGLAAERERIDALLGELRSPFWRYLRPSLASMRALLDGRFEEAETLALEAAAAQGSPRMPLEAAMASQIGMIRLEQGRFAELLPVLDAIARKLPYMPALHAGRALALMEAERPGEARAVVDALAPGDFDAVIGTESWPAALAWLSDVCVRLSDASRAGILYRLLSPRASQCLIVANGRCCLGPVALVLGRLALCTGDLEAADRHLETALEIAEVLRSPVLEAHTRLALARLRHDQGDPSQARGRASEASALAEEYALERVRRDLAASGLLPRRRRGAERP